MYIKSLFILLILTFISPICAHAATHISAGIIDSDTVWTASSSPYILDGSLSVIGGHSLTLEPGVVIDTYLTGDTRPMLSVDNSVLIISGTQDKPVTVRNLWDVDLFRSRADISHMNMVDVEGGFSLYESEVNIGYSLFKGSDNAIMINGGNTNISTTSLSAVHSIISIENSAPVLVRTDSGYGTGGIGNALDPYTAVVNISNSSISSTSPVTINNSGAKSGYSVHAQGNWWGNATGPIGTDAIHIIGPVEYAPWLEHEPDLVEHDKAVCCSSILFIPGIEASRLYRDEKGLFGFGTTTNTLWEPNRNDDVRKLFLNSVGSTTDKSIYSGNPIDSAWGYHVYESFMKFLDGLVAQGSIGSWYGYGYDWRKSIPEVVTGTEKKSTTTDSLINEVSRLAKDSKTGKVTIVAHSNGGLVTKYLVKVLSDRGMGNLIDSVISVAVPYIGTPQAIGGLLYGDGQSLAGGLLLKSSVAQQLGQNMPSAYSLLPSAKYNSKVLDVQSPTTTLNKSLLASAGDLHSILDNFNWPSHIINWAIVGWNALTTKSLTFTKTGHDTLKTNMGDGTVMAQSAVDGSDHISAVNLHVVGNGKTEHANILESNEVQTVVKNIIENSTKSDSTKVTEDLVSKVPGLTIGEPDYSKEHTYVVVSTHSPIIPHVYDSEGRHTGEIAPPPDTEDLYTAFENNIPGSSFETVSNNNPNTDNDYSSYIYLPDNGQKYSVIMNGTGVGTFRFDIDRYEGSNLLNHTEYADLPVTPLTVASTSIQFVPYEDSASALSASTTFVQSLQPLSIDVNGDGQTDIIALHDATSTATRKFKNKIKKGREKEAGDIAEKIRDFGRGHVWKKWKNDERKQLKAMIEAYLEKFE